MDLRSTDATTLQRVERERAAFIARLAEALQICGARHDAQGMARICPSARIFMPTVKGISHNPREQTAPPASRTARTYCSRCWWGWRRRAERGRRKATLDALELTGRNADDGARC